jgi:DNA mismatch repair protein MutS2
LQEEIRQTRQALARARQPAEALQTIEEKVEILEAVIEKPIERRPVDLPVQRPLRLGDKVRLRTLNTQGILTALGGEEAEVQVGVLRVRARLADVEAIGGEQPATTVAQPEISSVHAAIAGLQTTILPESPGIELDLRGRRAEDALDDLEHYLDAAFLAGLPWVRLIHGKGTGKLRQVVRERLSQHPHVKSFEAGGDKEGGEGVTVAKMASGG